MSTTIKISISDLSKKHCCGIFKTENYLDSLPSELSSKVTATDWQEFKRNVDTIMEELYQQVRILGHIEIIFKWIPVFVIILYIIWDKSREMRSVIRGLFVVTVMTSVFLSFTLRKRLFFASKVAEINLEEEFRKLARHAANVSFTIQSERSLTGNNLRVTYRVEITIGDIEEMQPQKEVVRTEVEPTDIDTGVVDSQRSPVTSFVEFTAIPPTYYGNIDHDVYQPQLTSAAMFQGSSDHPLGDTIKNGKKCKQCGDVNEKGTKFCANCGNKL